MPNSQNLCEYYFDSHIERISGDHEKIKDPCLYFERNVDNKDLSYRLFAIVKEWLPDANAEESYYDTVKLCYKQGSTDCAAVYAKKENLRIFKKQTNSLDSNVISVDKSGNILLINEAENFNPSGVGCIEMFKGETSIARFYFGVNCVFRKKIFYTVKVNGKNAELTFQCKTAPKDGIRVRLLGHARRLPCLVSDRDNCLIGDPINLNFKNGWCQVKVGLPDSLVSSSESKLYVSLEKECETTFILISKENGTLPEAQPQKPLRPSYTCPFCHSAIDVELEKTKAYRLGGAPCNAKNKTKKATQIRDENGNLKKRCLICKNEFNGERLRPGEIHKILPDDFLGHTNFKIAFQGAPRAGKTTYISRFFGIESKIKQSGRDTLAADKTKTIDDLEYKDFSYNISMSGMQNTAGMFGINVDPILIKSINSDGNEDGAWMNKEMEYVKRGMEIGRKLPSTDHRDYTMYPFIVEVNHKNYVSFYDIAGEDSMSNSNYIKKIAENDEKTIGIFFIVTATNQAGGGINEMVAKQLRNAAEDLDTSCPVAVILTKMDAIGDRFDSSCACRRFDYYPPSKYRDFIYDGSSVEKFINDSSEEIKSFIESSIGGVNIENADRQKSDTKRFTNVKYFCISSFGFPESTFHDKDDIDEASYMRFATSTRRMELPFVWMMRQFGIIKN